MEMLGAFKKEAMLFSRDPTNGTALYFCSLMAIAYPYQRPTCLSYTSTCEFISNISTNSSCMCVATCFTLYPVIFFLLHPNTVLINNSDNYKMIGAIPMHAP